MNPALAMTGGPVSTPVASWLTARRVLLLAACYFLLQGFVRTLISDSAELDESHQVLCAQTWQWGYGSDPPLYTWLQILTFQVTGINVLGLALLKNALLLSAFVFTYLAAKAATGDERMALVAMLSLFLFPQITWESQRDLTHSVLATAMAAATFFVALNVVRTQAPAWYLLLGVCVGLGTLSKYSYCLYALALAIAALSMANLRPVLLNRWFLLTLAALGVIIAFHVRWISLSPDLALVRSEQLLKNIDARPVTARALGVLSVIKCVFMLGAAISVACVIAFWTRTRTEGSAIPSPVQHWIRRTLVVILFMALGIVLATGVQLKDRWFQPITFLLAIAAVFLVQHRLTARAERRFSWMTVSVGMLALVLLAAIPLAASITKRPTRLNAPYSALAPPLRAAVGNPAVVVAATRLVGGNLRLHFQESKVVSPEFQALSLDPGVPWVVVWDATKSASPSRPLTELITRLRGVNLAHFPPQHIEAAFKYTRAKKMRLAYVELPAALTGTAP